MSIKYIFSKIMQKIQIPSVKNSSIDSKAKIYEGCNLNKVKLGRYSYVGKRVLITDAEIGNFCSIGANCGIGGGMHPLKAVSTSPVFLEGRSAVGYNLAQIPYKPSATVHIGNDVWIGMGVYIKAGVTIGNGAVIGANAVVTKDIEPYAVAAGVPARVLYKRFDDETIEMVERLKWWNWSDADLKKYGSEFDTVDKLLAKVKEDWQ